MSDDYNEFVATEDDLKELVEPTEGGSVTLPSTPPKKSEVGAVVVSEKIETPHIISTPKDPQAQDIETDYKYIRSNLYSITEKSIDALENLSQIAEQSHHPRAYEVLAQLVKTISEAQKDLMALHEKRIKVDGDKIEQNGIVGPEVVNNNLFVGTAANLDELIAKMIKKKNDDA